MRTTKPWISYRRVSTEDQVEAGVSLEMQVESCRSYARARGWTLAGEETDEGISGATMQRPGLARCLAAVREGKVAGIIVWKLDRLTRNLRHLLDIVDLCDHADAALVSVTEAIDASTPAGRLMLNMLGSFGQHERETIAVRITAAMQHVRSRGYWTGGHIPPGCEVVQDGERRRLVRGPHADTVQQVWAWILAGDGLTICARRLHEAGVPAPGHVGKPAAKGWTPKAVWNFIRSRQVTGLLVDAATQQAAVAVLAARQTPTKKERTVHAKRTENPSIVAGLAKCPVCGSALIHTVARGNGGDYRYLRCTLANKNRALCTQKDLRAEVIEQAALGAVIDAMQRQDYRRAILADLEQAQAQADALRAERGRLTSQRQQISAKIAHMAREVQITAAFHEALGVLGRDAEAIDRDLARVAGQLSVADVDMGSIRLVLDSMERLAPHLADAPPAEQAEILREWVRTVSVHPDRVVVEFYAPQKAGTPGDRPEVRAERAIGTPGNTGHEPRRVVKITVPGQFLTPRRPSRASLRPL